MIQLSYKLEVFEGPLDLLLSLIGKNKINILDIPIAELFDQYMEQITAMKEASMEVAGEFLVMASRLLYIKTVSLLPKQEEEAEQLKKELAGELMEYQLCRDMAGRLADMADYDAFSREEMKIEADRTYRLHHEVGVLFEAYLAAASRVREQEPDKTAAFGEIVARPVYSVSTCIVNVLGLLYRETSAPVQKLFRRARSKSEAVATFLAVLELLKAERISLDEDGVLRMESAAPPEEGEFDTGFYDTPSEDSEDAE